VLLSLPNSIWGSAFRMLMAPVPTQLWESNAWGLEALCRRPTEFSSSSLHSQRLEHAGKS
jgi:hypothetical protein